MHTNECMQSFTLRIDQPILCSAANGTVKTWGTVGDYNFSAKTIPSNTVSIFDLTGFKRTDIYGITVIGSVQGNPGSINSCCVVTDWSFDLTLGGQAPLVSGKKSTTSDGFLLYTNTPLVNTFSFSKNTNSIMFANPFQSVTTITFEQLVTQGIGAEFLNVVALNYDLSFTFYYTYEGE